MISVLYWEYNLEKNENNFGKMVCEKELFLEK